MTPEYLKDFLQQHNLKPNFTYGQNFLMDEMVLEEMIEAANVTKEDNVLEIGPGIGNLTERLCQHAGFVLSVEKDPKFQPLLQSVKKEHKNFRYEIDDALEYDFVAELQKGAGGRVQGAEDAAAETTPSALHPVPYKVVANIPYYVTGKILQMLLNARVKPTSVTVLMQKEVARNVTAKEGNLSILAISVQLYGDPKIIKIVPGRSFYPAPKVDSAVLHIDVYSKPKYNVPDEKKFFKLVKACFAGKRKQLHNTLANYLHADKETTEKILAKAGINPAARPQELSIQKWIDLQKQIFNF